MAKTIIFTRRDFDKLKEAERIIHDTLPLIDAADRCGIPCDEIREAAAELQKSLAAIEREFMTPPPPR